MSCVETIEITRTPTVVEIEDGTRIAEIQTPAAVEAEIAGDEVVAEVETSEIDVHISDGGGQLRAVKIDFTYATTSPVTIAIQAVEEIAHDATIVVSQAFDDTASRLLLGYSGDPDFIFETDDVKPKRLGTWFHEGPFSTASVKTVVLTIQPGSSTQGAGYVLLSLTRH